MFWGDSAGYSKGFQKGCQSVDNRKVTLLPPILSFSPPSPISEYKTLNTSNKTLTRLLGERHKVCMSTCVSTILGGGTYYGCKVCTRQTLTRAQLLWWFPHWNKLHQKGEKKWPLESCGCNMYSSFWILEEFYICFLVPAAQEAGIFPRKLGVYEGVMCAPCFITPPLFLQANLSPP